MPKVQENQIIVCLSSSEDGVELNKVSRKIERTEEIILLSSSNKEKAVRNKEKANIPTQTAQTAKKGILNFFSQTKTTKPMPKVTERTVKVTDKNFVAPAKSTSVRTTTTQRHANEFEDLVNTLIPAQTTQTVPQPQRSNSINSTVDTKEWDESALKKHNAKVENKIDKKALSKSNIMMKIKDFTHENLEKKLDVHNTHLIEEKTMLQMAAKSEDNKINAVNTRNIEQKDIDDTKNKTNTAKQPKTRGRPRKTTVAADAPAKKTKVAPVTKSKSNYTAVENRLKKVPITMKIDVTTNNTECNNDGKYKCIVQGKGFEQILFLNDDDMISKLYDTIFETGHHGKLFYECNLMLKSLNAYECSLFEGDNLIEVEEGRIKKGPTSKLTLIKNKADGTTEELKVDKSEVVGQYLENEKIFVKNGVVVPKDMEFGMIFEDKEVFDEIDTNAINFST